MIPGQDFDVTAKLLDGEPFFTGSIQSDEPPVLKMIIGSETQHVLSTRAPGTPGNMRIQASVTDRAGHTAEATTVVKVVPPLALTGRGMPDQVAPGARFSVAVQLEPGDTAPPWDLEARGSVLAAPVRIQTRSLTPELSVTASPRPASGPLEILVAGKSKVDGKIRKALYRHSLKVVPGFAMSWTKCPKKVAPEAQVEFSYRASGAQKSLRSWVAHPGRARSRDLDVRSPEASQGYPGSFRFQAPKKLGSYPIRIEAMDGTGEQSVLTTTLEVILGDAPLECTQLRPKVHETYGKTIEIDLGIGGYGPGEFEYEENVRWDQLGCSRWYPNP